MPKKWVIHIAFILIYAPWPTKKTTVAHRLKTPALNDALIFFLSFTNLLSNDCLCLSDVRSKQ